MFAVDKEPIKPRLRENLRDLRGGKRDHSPNKNLTGLHKTTEWLRHEITMKFVT